MARLGNFSEDVNPDIVKVDKEDILSSPFCFQKAYYRDTADGQYWKVYGTFFNAIGDSSQELFFIVPASESRDLLMNAMNAASPLHFCALEKQSFTPKDGKLAQTFYAFVAMDKGVCPCGEAIADDGHHMQDFLAGYKGITKEEMELRAEYPKVDKSLVLDVPFCLEKVVLKPARDADSRPYWAVYVNLGDRYINATDTGTDHESNKVMFFLPSSPSRDRLFKSFEDEMPIHCSKMLKKSWTPKGQKEPVDFYSLEDTKNPVCACGCDLNDGQMELPF